MRNIQFILIVLLFLSIFSCADKFVNDLDIELPEEEQFLVINLELNEGDTLAKTFVARTSNLDEVEHTFFENATVDLYKEDSFLKNLEYDPLKNDYIANFNPNELTAGNYRVEVSGVPNFDDIISFQTIPDAVNILKGSYQEDGTIGEDYGYAYTVDEARITIDDPADEENYYEVQLTAIRESKEGEIIVEESFVLTSLNPFAESSFYYSGILLKDDSFNGTDFDLSMGFNNFLKYNYNEEDETVDYLIVELSNISKDNYLFIKSEAASREARDNPFAEPVIVHNNVENGVGIFRTRNTTTYRIDL